MLDAPCNNYFCTVFPHPPILRRGAGGEMPLYINAVQRDYIIPASIAAGLGKIG